MYLGVLYLRTLKWINIHGLSFPCCPCGSNMLKEYVGGVGNEPDEGNVYICNYFAQIISKLFPISVSFPLSHSHLLTHSLFLPLSFCSCMCVLVSTMLLLVYMFTG